MRISTTPGLCLGASILLAVPAVFADSDKKGQSQQSVPGVQIQIDKATGRKISPEDVATSASSGTAVSAIGPIAKSDPVLPSETGDVVYHENGMMSAVLGQEHLKYLVMTIDQDGNRTVSHQSSETNGADSAQTGVTGEER